MRRETRLSTLIVFPLLALLCAASSLAQTPGEVSAFTFADRTTLTWNPVLGADSYNVYRGTFEDLASGVPARCHGHQLAGSVFSTPAEPDPGRGYFYLATADSAIDGEGSPGNDSADTPRALLGTCGPVMRGHVLDRLGYGWNAWSRDRIETLGLAGYIDEQLLPFTISETDNTELNTRLAPYDPPQDILDLIARQVVLGVYARRQLEQQVATFWSNHFNTFWLKLADLYATAYPDCNSGLPQCDPNYPEIAYIEATLAQHREMEDFRNLSFRGGSFGEILKASALSPAMILFLDTFASVAGAPNENYPRELLELYTMGVDGGYTQQDVEELARVITGWTICKKELGFLDSPTAPCIASYWLNTPPGEWTATFVEAQHDCTAKTLFAGTPQEVVIPDTCSDPIAGVDDYELALDAIIDHPATATFISTKILKHFVTDNPDQQMIDAVVAAWNDAGNPGGKGDIRAVLVAALTQAAMLDPDLVGGKIKTPLEHVISAIRSVAGNTDGLTFVLDTLVLAQHIPHYNPVPTGYPETGAYWVDTTNTLERQNFAALLVSYNDTEFGSDPTGFLGDNGVSTAPGNEEAIVDFFAEVMFGSALTPAERQNAIDFLITDDLGDPLAYDDLAIRKLVAYLLGFPQFQEQ